MKSIYYSFCYLNILLIIFFFINNIFLFLIILIMRGVFYINLESDIEYEFNFLNLDFERFDAKFLEIDIDDQYLYTLVNQEIYLNYNCRFFFDFYGGVDTLDSLDFLDFTIYNKDNLKNFKYIYSTLFFKNEYSEDYIFKTNDIMLRMYIDDYYFKLGINDNEQYNILYKIDIKNKIKKKQFDILKQKYE
jgi:hypothetical protein